MNAFPLQILAFTCSASSPGIIEPAVSPISGPTHRTFWFLLTTTFMVFGIPEPASAADPGCTLQRTSYAGYTVWRDAEMLIFTSGMAVDADGSPRAYHPDNSTGLDDIHNAGSPGDWSALATINGVPVVQGPNDDAPGYYVSMTSLEDDSVKGIVPSRFVDSEQVPYIALPPDLPGPRLGDLGLVVNVRNGRSSPVIFADHSPENRLGEGSIRLANALGINPDPRHGGTNGGIVYIVFPNSGEKAPLPTDVIVQRVERLRQKWLEMGELNACIAGDGNSIMARQR